MKAGRTFEVGDQVLNFIVGFRGSNVPEVVESVSDTEIKTNINTYLLENINQPYGSLGLMLADEYLTVTASDIQALREF